MAGDPKRKPKSSSPGTRCLSLLEGKPGRDEGGDPSSYDFVAVSLLCGGGTAAAYGGRKLATLAFEVSTWSGVSSMEQGACGSALLSQKISASPRCFSSIRFPADLMNAPTLRIQFGPKLAQKN